MNTVETNVKFEEQTLPSGAGVQPNSFASYEKDIGGSWDQELFDLVAANVEVTIKSPWHQGSEMTLRAAILSAPQITEANVNIFVADVRGAIAEASIITTEECEDEAQEENEQPEAEVEAEEKVDDNTVSENIAEPETPTTPEVEEGPAVAKEANSAGHESVEIGLASRPENINTARAESMSTLTATDKTEVTAKSSNGSVREPSQPSNNTKNEAAAKTEIITKEQKPVRDEVKPSIIVNAPVEVDRTQSNIKTIQEREQTPEAILAEAKPEPVESMPNRLEVEDILIPAEELANAAVSDMAELEAPSHQPAVGEMTDFLDAQEVSIDHFAETEEELSEQLTGVYMFEEVTIEADPEDKTVMVDDYELQLIPSNEADALELFVPDSLIVEKIETIMEPLAVAVEQAQATIETVKEIFDKVVETPATPVNEAAEKAITENKAVMELEKLFTALLEDAGIDYTSEQITSLAQLAYKRRLAKQIEAQAAENSDDASTYSVTHEVIIKPLVGLNNLQRAVVHAGAIGKSALQLSFAA